MSPKNVLITGCNRGIGLELVKHYLKLASPPTNLLATFRDEKSSEELLKMAEENANLHALKFDIVKRDTFAAFASQVSDIVKDQGLNLVIQNSGYLADNRELDNITPEDMIYSYEVNCVGPLFLTRELLPLLKAAVSKDKPLFTVDNAACVLMSTAVASIAENSGGKIYPYRCSKTGLNMAMKSLSVDLKDTGILIMAMHPGWVKTRMGGPNALIDTETCVSTMIETLQGLTEKDHGTLLRYNNTSIPW